MVRIDHGEIDPTSPMNIYPESQWEEIVEKRHWWVDHKITHDCRALCTMAVDAEQYHDKLGYDSAAQMIEEGYGLDATEASLAIAWLKHNQPDKPIPLERAVEGGGVLVRSRLVNPDVIGNVGRPEDSQQPVSIADAQKIASPLVGESNYDNYNNLEPQPEGSKLGTSANYLAGRIKKAADAGDAKAAEVFANLENFKSVRAAAIEAKVIKPKPTTTVRTDDAAAAAKTLLKHYTADELIAAIKNA